MLKKKTVAFIIGRPYLGAFSCYVEPIRRLAQKGWGVDVYTTVSDTDPKVSFNEKNVRIFEIRSGRWGWIALLWQLFKNFSSTFLVFAIPQKDLFLAYQLKRFLNIPYICISDELYSLSDTLLNMRNWKLREKKAHQHATATIALSKDRAEFIRQENKLGESHRFFVIPNSASGPCQSVKANFYEKRFPVENKTILLHLGSLASLHSQELIREAEAWPDRYALIFQGRSAHMLEGQSQKKRIFFNREVLPEEAVSEAVRSAHIGIGIYHQGWAYGHVGFASGKLGVYLKNGLPVIFLKQASFNFIEENGLGICVERITDIPAAADRIMERYEFYRANVKKFYDENLVYEKNAEPLMQFVESLAGPA